MSTTQRKDHRTGDGTSVGLFIPLPPSLARQYPDLSPDDKSPSHVTFLYVGEVTPEQEPAFLSVTQRVLAEMGSSVEAFASGLEYFDHPAEDQRIAVQPVRFSKDMAALRERLRDTLIEEGFDVKDSFPLVYQPHITLRYMKGIHSRYDGVVPTAKWEFDSMEVWGLPRVHQVKTMLFRRVASHRKSVALMKFLSGVANRLGVGRHVYVVGGAVRNFVINQPIKDLDVVIDSVALNGRDSAWFAEQVAKAIPVEVNLVTNNYGVAILTIKGDWELHGEPMKGEVIEIANARKESYGDEVGNAGAGKGYKPHTVAPATIDEDIYRREFTFNTLLWRLMDLADGPDKAEIIDLTGCGLRDLQQGILTCPREPDIVFSDDPSRLIRVVKFTQKYGFKIPPDVRASIKRNAHKLKKVPSGHLSNMIISLFYEAGVGKPALIEMDKLGLLDVIKEIVQTDRPFREALSNWVDRKGEISFMFDLMDLGMPSGKRLGFLPPDQRERVREIVVGLSAREADAFVAVLEKPGKVIDMGALISEFKLSGREIRALTTTAQVCLLEDPSLAAVPARWEAKIRQRMGGMPRTAEDVEARIHLKPNQWIDDRTKELDPDQAERVWHLYHVSYGNIGTHISGVDQLLNEYEKVWVNDIDGNDTIDALIAYKKTPAGNKLSVLASDGSKAAKKAVIIKAIKLLNTPGWWGEISGRPAQILEAAGVPKVTDEAMVRAILRKDIRWLGDGEYERNIGTIGAHVKAIYGKPRVRPSRMASSDEVPPQLRRIRDVRRWGSGKGKTSARAIRIPKDSLRKMAGKIRRMLQKLLPWTDKPIGSRTWGQLSLPLPRLDGRAIDVILMVVSRPSSGPYFVSQGAAGKVKHTGQPVMVVEVNGRYSGEEYHRSMDGTPEVIENQIYQVLIHEATHVVDEFAGPLGSRLNWDNVGQAGEADWAAYYNSPGEVRAHLQEIVDEVEQKLNWLPKMEKTFGPSKGLQMLLNTSSTWGKIKPYLSARNKQYIIKAVATAIRDKSRTAAMRITDDTPIEGFDLYRKTVPTKAVRMDEPFEVETLEGVMKGKAGDWLAEGPEGERYPIDASIFDKSYEKMAARRVATRHLATTTTKDGRPITFKWVEHSPNEMALDRGWVVHRVEAYVDGRQVGFLDIGYIPRELFLKLYPTVWHWAIRNKGWVPKKPLLEAVESEDWNALWERVYRYFKWVPDPELVPFEDRLEDILAYEKRFVGGFREFRRFHVDKPLVDYIHVEPEFRRQGVGTALYGQGARWLAEKKRLPLYASGLQSDEAKATWQSMKTRGLPVHRDQARTRMDFRKWKPRTAAARYKQKKKVKTKDGEDRTVYVYSERQVANRHREKAERVEKLRHKIDDLRKQVRKDLNSDDEKTRAVALAVGLMDATYERVGNEGSAKEGHYGVTGWKVKHLTVGRNKITIKYVGKSGVKHEKVIDRPESVKAIKEAIKDKKDDDEICGCTAQDVNDYLKPFGITAKDIRGYHANTEMQNRLKAIRSKGGKLPEDKKEREKKLKDEFKQALEETADAVGHEPATLKSQYLVPGMEDEYLKDGNVSEKLTKKASMRVANSLPDRWSRLLAQRPDIVWGRFATKTDAEKEEEETERLVRPAPKKKPPRHDLRRQRIEPEKDKDLDRATAENDRDLSRNYKKIAERWLESKRLPHSERKRRKRERGLGQPANSKGSEHSPGDVWETEGGWAGMNAEGQKQYGMATEEEAKAFARGSPPPEEKPTKKRDLRKIEIQGPPRTNIDTAEMKVDLAAFPPGVYPSDAGLFAVSPQGRAVLFRPYEKDRARAYSEGWVEEFDAGVRTRPDKEPKDAPTPKERKEPTPQKKPEPEPDWGSEEPEDVIEGPEESSKEEDSEEDFDVGGGEEEAPESKAPEKSPEGVTRLYSELKKQGESEIAERLLSYTPEAQTRLLEAYRSARLSLAHSSVDDDLIDRVVDASRLLSKRGIGAENFGQALAAAEFGRKVLSDPLRLAGKELGEAQSIQELEDRSVQAFHYYMALTPEIRDEALRRIAPLLEQHEEGSAERQELEAILDGLHLASWRSGDPDTERRALREDPSETLEAMIEELEKKNVDVSALLRRDFYSPEGEESLRAMMDEMDDDALVSIALPRRSPVADRIQSMLRDSDLEDWQREMLREMLGDFVTDQIGAVRDALNAAHKTSMKNAPEPDEFDESDPASWDPKGTPPEKVNRYIWEKVNQDSEVVKAYNDFLECLQAHADMPEDLEENPCIALRDRAHLIRVAKVLDAVFAVYPNADRNAPAIRRLADAVNEKSLKVLSLPFVRSE